MISLFEPFICIHAFFRIVIVLIAYLLLQFVPECSHLHQSGSAESSRNSRYNRLIETVIVIGIVISFHAGLQYMRSIRQVRVKR